MKNKKWQILIFVLVLGLTISNSCKKEPQIIITKELISGYIQKGPFINGSSIIMTELNSELFQTGKNFNTQIHDNKGSFEFKNTQLESPFVELKADGYYYNEVKGEKTTAPITLYAISDVTDIVTLNVNILTHLEKSRVEYLVSKGESFKNAKIQAIKEVLNIFGISEENMESPELLNISGEGNNNAILLAISVIVQGNRSVAELVELLANMSLDIREDGILDNESIGNSLVSQCLELHLQEIRNNIEKRFSELGLNIIPGDFEKYIKEFAENSDFKVAKFDISSNLVDLGEYSTSSFFYIINKGNGTLNWILDKGEESSFYYNFENGTVNPFDSVKIIVTADRPYLFGTKTSKVTIVTDIGNSEINISIKVNVPTIEIISSYETDIFDTKGYLTGRFTTIQNEVSEVGFCWNTSTNPTIADNHMKADWSGVLTDLNFNKIIENFDQNTVYYIRAYVINPNSGVGYSSNEIVRKTKETITNEYSTTTDYDGNIYKTVHLGNQWWFAENLKSTHYANGQSLIDGTQIEDLKGDLTTKYYFTSPYPPVNDGLLTQYGRYYTWAAVMNEDSLSNSVPSGVQGICPTGWHVPSGAEFQILSSFITSHGYSNVASALRSECLVKQYWDANKAQYYSNPSGFSLLFGGVRGYDFGSYAVAEWNYGLWLSNGQAFNGFSNSHEMGMNCRCIKD